MPVTLQSPGESVILAALRDGDVRRACELLLDTYQDEVYQYCARLVGTDDAVAVYQRVLATAIAELGTLPAQASVRAWIYGIARNSVTHYHRSDHRAHPGSLDPAYVPVEGAAAAAPITAEDPALARAMRSMPAPIREVLQLALWHGLRMDEIAHVTGTDPGEIRSMAASGLSLINLSLQHGGAQPS